MAGNERGYHLMRLCPHTDMSTTAPIQVATPARHGALVTNGHVCFAMRTWLHPDTPRKKSP